MFLSFSAAHEREGTWQAQSSSWKGESARTEYPLQHILVNKDAAEIKFTFKADSYFPSST